MTYIEEQERIAEIDIEIAEIRAAQTAIRKGGQSYLIDSGGSKRSVTMADYTQLTLDIKRLQQERADLNDEGGLVFGVGW